MQTQELHRAVTPSNARAALALASDWGLVLLAWHLALVFGFWAWPLAIALLCRAQQGLAVLNHEAAHDKLFAGPGLNRFAGVFLCAAPLLFNHYLYRCEHLLHHRFVQTPKDPDFLPARLPVARHVVARVLARDLLGLTGIILLWRNLAGHILFLFGAKQNPTLRSAQAVEFLLALVASQAAILGYLAWLGCPEFYLGLWLAPKLTLYFFLGRIRGLAEHLGLSQTSDPLRCSRSIVGGFSRWIIAPHGSAHHAEHHLVPALPFFALANFSRQLSSRGELHETFPGYSSFLRYLIGLRPRETSVSAVAKSR